MAVAQTQVYAAVIRPSSCSRDLGHWNLAHDSERGHKSYLSLPGLLYFAAATQDSGVPCVEGQTSYHFSGP